MTSEENTVILHDVPDIVTYENSVKSFMETVKLLYKISNMMGWGDPFNYNRAGEIRAAIELGHKVADTFSGADAFDENGEPVEYKSCSRKIKVFRPGLIMESLVMNIGMIYTNT